jgi:NitT/TauT family transport system substrate-binding protein
MSLLRRTFNHALLAAALGLTLTGPGFAADLQKVTLQLDWLPQLGNAGPAFIAKKQGYYEAAGLDVTIQPGGTSASAVKVVAGGGAQFGQEYAGVILQARSQGAELVGLFGSYQKVPAGYVYHVGQDVKSIADFNGRTVYTQVASSNWETTKKTYKLDNVTDLQFQGYAAFAQDERAIAQGYGTTAEDELAEQGINVKWIPDPLRADDYPGTFFTTKQLIDTNPELVRNFVAATVKGWEFIAAHPDEAAQLLTEFVPDRSAAQLRKEIDQVTPFVVACEEAAHGFGYQTEARWEKVAAELVESGDIPSAEFVKGAFDPSFFPSK